MTDIQSSEMNNEELLAALKTEAESAAARVSRRTLLKWCGAAGLALCVVGPAVLHASRRAATQRPRREPDGSYRVQGWCIPH